MFSTKGSKIENLSQQKKHPSWLVDLSKGAVPRVVAATYPKILFYCKLVENFHFPWLLILCFIHWWTACPWESSHILSRWLRCPITFSAKYFRFQYHSQKVIGSLGCCRVFYPCLFIIHSPSIFWFSVFELHTSSPKLPTRQQMLERSYRRRCKRIMRTSYDSYVPYCSSPTWKKW